MRGNTARGVNDSTDNGDRTVTDEATVLMWKQGNSGYGMFREDALVGENTFRLSAEDVTPAPYNQPPYSPAGDTDSAASTVACSAP